MLRENKVLTSLRLELGGPGGVHIGPEGLCQLYSALAVNNSLTELYLFRSVFGDRSIDQLGKSSLLQMLALSTLRIAMLICVIVIVID